MDDMERREAAIKRLRERRDFWTHLVTYIVVNAFLVVVWFVTNDGGYFWPVWPIAGWGIGLLIHAFETFRRPIGEDAIRREMERGPR
ncbi:MAG: hypothetical protein A2135_00145 [Actinobacteria bacterium RBG_16_67_15]|nr:MAG: hypothetical protein A2135_00145 [Actinobacteria bacterium RBG_16_67_15]